MFILLDENYKVSKIIWFQNIQQSEIQSSQFNHNYSHIYKLLQIKQTQLTQNISVSSIALIQIKIFIINLMAPRHQSSSSSSSDAESSSSEQINFTTIIVSNLTNNITQDHLKQIFSNFGQIQSLGIRQSQSKQHSWQINRHAMINYSQQKDAQTAVQYMNDGWLDGLKIRVKMDNNSKQQDNQKSKHYDNHHKLIKYEASNPPLKSNNSQNAQIQQSIKREEESLSQIEPKKKDRSIKKLIKKSSHRKQERSKHGHKHSRYERSRSSHKKSKKYQSSRGRSGKQNSQSSRSSSTGKRHSKPRRSYSSSSSRS